MFQVHIGSLTLLVLLGLRDLLAIGYVIPDAGADFDVDSDHHMHPLFASTMPHRQRIHKRAMPMIFFPAQQTEEQYSEYWHSDAQSILEQQLASKTQLNTNVAKNVIMFLGDGMSIPTITASRVYLGGEEQQFAFERFPFVGLSKTYCANMQVADSACTATAYLGGVKANYGTIGVSAAVELKDCQAQANEALHVTSIAAWAQRQGMATGVITTTAVTHASPAGIYAHVANRNWENDADVLQDNADPSSCADIATQLLHGAVGPRLNVILGGGRRNFLPSSMPGGKRQDSHNLIEEWQRQHTKTGHYVESRDALMQLPNSTTHVLGLFADNHMPYHLDADATKMPTLEEMVASALPILERQSHGRGYFLFVEGGRIDHGHHDTLALRAIDETAEFDKAVLLARERTNTADTLIVVTSDHSHTMSVAGYSSRKNDIFGINNGQLAADELPYATLSYANGPGYDTNFLRSDGHGKRKNLRQLNMKDSDFKFPSMVPLESETHGGDDVAVFTSGPFAQLFTGVYEQNFIPHAIGYAACLGGRRSVCLERGIQRTMLK